MSKIVRYQGNVRAFASDAQGMERTVFGGTNQADDLTSQITASFLRGWGIVGASEHPSLEDFNAAMYAMSQFIAYQHQMGVPEWHAEQEYHIGSICTHNGESYQSLQNANIGSQPPSAKWTPVLTSKNGLANLRLVPGIILPEGYNIPAHIVNTPGIVYSAQFPGTYTNEPAFDGEWFDVYAAKHVSDACTFIAVSRTGKIATGSYSANTFSGWNYSLNSSNTTQAGRDLVAKNDATEMAKYLGLDVISGRLLNIVKMTASGTYTPTAGTKSIIVEAIGGGGASGNLTATGPNQNAVSAAGSNGAYAKASYTSGFSSVSVTIGAGGTVAGGGAGSGGDGGATSFGSLLTCPAGKGSPAGTAKTPPFNEGAAQPSGAPSGTGILISNKGPYSTWPTVVALGSASNFINAIGSQLGSYGLGGDGIAANVSESAKSGVAGNSGCVIVWEYA